jgi:hypothetical protein
MNDEEVWLTHTTWYPVKNAVCYNCLANWLNGVLFLCLFVCFRTLYISRKLAINVDTVSRPWQISATFRMFFNTSATSSMFRSIRLCPALSQVCKLIMFLYFLFQPQYHTQHRRRPIRVHIVVVFRDSTLHLVSVEIANRLGDLTKINICINWLIC